MNEAHKTLLGLYQLWSHWTHTETEAIQQEDWPRLEECHREKAILQEKIAQAEQLPGCGDQTTPFWRDQLRPALEILLRQERFNQDQLRAKRAHAQHQQAQARSAGRTLRRLHTAYAPLRGTGWQSYS